uniref:Phosphopantothenoylcysteine decarboxylase n=2 Tax=Pavo cristatus TaxID=9049 RepID=A0A8C9G394_PAVCR
MLKSSVDQGLNVQHQTESLCILYSPGLVLCLWLCVVGTLLCFSLLTFLCFSMLVEVGWTMEPSSPAETSSSVPQEKFHVLVGVTGSVAALKLPLLISGLLEIPGLEVKVVTTERAKHFYNPQEIPVTLYSDEDEWQLWKGRSDPVLHIELRRWADLMLVAPLDANTLAKLANGICDNLLTCVIRAWDLHKPLLFCPAMNTAMWEHPITAQQVEKLKGFGYTEIPCVVKKLVCGDEGRGAMAEVWTIVESVRRILEERGLPMQS